MPRICLPCGATPFGRPCHVLAATSALLLLSVGACGNSELSEDGSAGSAGRAASGGAPHAAAGARATSSAGNTASVPDAGAGGQRDESAAGAAGNAQANDQANEAAAAGTGSERVACTAGDAPFVVGNYQNVAGDQLLLRSTATASTLALVSQGAARPSAPPQLFLVERSCAPGGALLVRDQSAHYRLDFRQTGGRLALCSSAPVATLDAAARLTPGCASKPFSMYDAVGAVMLRSAIRLGIIGALCAVPVSAPAADDGYLTKPSYNLSLPGSDLSYTTAADSFGGDVTTSVSGYPLRGRFLSATGKDVLLQKNFGADLWLDVASVPENMDPGFLRIAPSGAKIALGTGSYQPLYVFATSVLRVATPPDLSKLAGVKIFEENYYDAAWRGDRYLFINAGSDNGGSQIYAVDSDGTTGTPIPIIADIPGASGGIAFDTAGDLVTGIGFGDHTGQLKIWSAASVSAALEGSSLSYASSGQVLVEGALSAASLGFDAGGNLYVGGGDAFGSSGHYGYAAIVTAAVVQRVLTGGAPADPESAADYFKVQPDPCHNDDATNVWYSSALACWWLRRTYRRRPTTARRST